MMVLSPVRYTCRLSVMLAVALLAVLAAPSSAQDSEPDMQQRVQLAYDDFLHFARIGRFEEAKAFAQKLLDMEGLTPEMVLVAAEKDRESVPTLQTLIRHTSLTEQAQAILDLIREGEHQQRKERSRILKNIEKLGGPPQMEYRAVQRLKDSGEYAIPDMVAVLLDESRKRLWPRVLAALPQMGREAVGPLVQALDIEEENVRRQLIWALGELGYPQAIPFLLRIVQNDEAPSETQAAAITAIQAIEGTTARVAARSAVDAYLRLANQYYAEHGSVQADPRVSTANVWYLRDGRLVAVPVPTEIFGAVMAMRTCEEALMHEPAEADAIALWLAANFRREARLGMDVESVEPDAGADADQTRPEGFPRSLYFARAAGAAYCHRVLTRAVAGTDKHVALGAIAALDEVGGEASLVAGEAGRLSLVEAMRFPDSEVRLKAAIALARTLPKTPFSGADLVPHLLAEAIVQPGQPQYIVIIKDQEQRNRLAGEMRATGATVIAAEAFLPAMEQARRELSNVAGIVMATDIDSPTMVMAIDELRDDPRFARVPVVMIVQDDQTHRAEPVRQRHPRVREVDELTNADEVLDALRGQDGDEDELDRGIGAELAEELALRSTEVLRLVAVDGQTVIDTTPVIPALVTALVSDIEELRINAAQVLALLPPSKAQQAVARLAINSDTPEIVQLAAFVALAESAKRFGNKLQEDQVSRVVEIAGDTSDLTLSAAASRALGALNLQTNEASKIIRGYHRG